MKVRCTNCMKEFDENKIIYSEEEKEMKEMQILLKEDVKAKVDEIGWSVYENEKDIDFSTWSAFGGDIDIIIDKGKNLIDLAHNIYEYWDNYDVSYEASLWIGEDGHGKNGAPYDLKDIYEDMEGVKNMINDLYNVINEEAKIEKEKKQISRYTLKDKRGPLNIGYCPNCGELLLKSDLPQYNYVGPLYEENFYDCEVK